MPLRRLAMAVSLACMIAAAQERLTFEAASVKPVESAGGGGGGGGQSVVRKTAGPSPRKYEEPTGGPGTTDPGRIHYPMVTLHFVLTKAYGVNDYQIVGPDWLDRDRFDIDATMPRRHHDGAIPDHAPEPPGRPLQNGVPQGDARVLGLLSGCRQGRPEAQGIGGFARSRGRWRS